MQEFIVHIIVALCILWAFVMIYKRFKGGRKQKCSDCPLSKSCGERGGYDGCSVSGKPRQTKCGDPSAPKHYSAN